MKVVERNRGWAKTLFENILQLEPSIQSVLEVGCGIGTALEVATKKFKLSTVGYDTNTCATDWGKENYSLSLNSELWQQGVSENSDLTLCISVLNILKNPYI